MKISVLKDLKAGIIGGLKKFPWFYWAFRGLYVQLLTFGRKLNVMFRQFTFKQTPFSESIVNYRSAELVAQKKSRICIFAHFDSKGEVAPLCLKYLKEILENGFDVLFVSASGELDPLSIKQLEAIGCGVIVKKNQGYDFGSWHTGLRLIGAQLHDYQGLLLVNDSVYGPFGELRPLFQKVFKVDSGREIVGLTDSYEMGHHLQSYFLYMSKAVLNSRAFQKFIREYSYNLSKKEIITLYEVGLSRRLKREGFVFKALYPYVSIDQKRVCAQLGLPKIQVNPTIYLWYELITDLNFPFIKRELILKNPGGAQAGISWEQVLRKKNAQSLEMILKQNLCAEAK